MLGTSTGNADKKKKKKKTPAQERRAAKRAENFLLNKTKDLLKAVPSSASMPERDGGIKIEIKREQNSGKDENRTEPKDKQDNKNDGAPKKHFEDLYKTVMEALEPLELIKDVDQRNKIAEIIEAIMKELQKNAPKDSALPEPDTLKKIILYNLIGLIPNLCAGILYVDTTLTATPAVKRDTIGTNVTQNFYFMYQVVKQAAGESAGVLAAKAGLAAIFALPYVIPVLNSPAMNIGGMVFSSNLQAFLQLMGSIPLNVFASDTLRNLPSKISQAVKQDIFGDEYLNILQHGRDTATASFNKFIKELHDGHDVHFVTLPQGKKFPVASLDGCPIFVKQGDNISIIGTTNGKEWKNIPLDSKEIAGKLDDLFPAASDDGKPVSRTLKFHSADKERVEDLCAFIKAKKAHTHEALDSLASRMDRENQLAEQLNELFGQGEMPDLFSEQPSTLAWRRAMAAVVIAGAAVVFESSWGYGFSFEDFLKKNSAYFAQHPTQAFIAGHGLTTPIYTLSLTASKVLPSILEVPWTVKEFWRSSDYWIQAIPKVVAFAASVAFSPKSYGTSWGLTQQYGPDWLAKTQFGEVTTIGGTDAFNAIWGQLMPLAVLTTVQSFGGLLLQWKYGSKLHERQNTREQLFSRRDEINKSTQQQFEDFVLNLNETARKNLLGEELAKSLPAIILLHRLEQELKKNLDAANWSTASGVKPVEVSDAKRGDNGPNSSEVEPLVVVTDLGAGDESDESEESDADDVQLSREEEIQQTEKMHEQLKAAQQNIIEQHDPNSLFGRSVFAKDSRTVFFMAPDKFAEISSQEKLFKQKYAGHYVCVTTLSIGRKSIQSEQKKASQLSVYYIQRDGKYREETVLGDPSLFRKNINALPKDRNKNFQGISQIDLTGEEVKKIITANGKHDCYKVEKNLEAEKMQQRKAAVQAMSQANGHFSPVRDERAEPENHVESGNGSYALLDKDDPKQQPQRSWWQKCCCR